MATRASFHPGPPLVSRPQPPSAGSSPFGEPPLRTLALPSGPTARIWWTGSVAGAGGTLVGALPRARWKKSGSASLVAACLLNGSPDGTTGGSGGGGKKDGSPGGGGSWSSNDSTPQGRSASGITRPLGEILSDLINKEVPRKMVNTGDRSIPWYHANELLSQYAPGWCGEVREVNFSQNGIVTVVYRVTVRGSDGEAYRESTGTVSTSYRRGEGFVAAAEEIAFCRACARFGLGLYLYYGDKNK